MDIAIQKQPDNVSFYTAKGSALEKIGREDDAIEKYKQSIVMDPSLYIPYYNKGVNLIDEANNLTTNASNKE